MVSLLHFNKCFKAVGTDGVISILLGILKEQPIMLDLGPFLFYNLMHISSHFKSLTHYSLRVPPEIVVWIYNTFDYNFRIRNELTKYLKKSCR